MYGWHFIFAHPDLVLCAWIVSEVADCCYVRGGYVSDAMAGRRRDEEGRYQTGLRREYFLHYCREEGWEA